MVATLPTLKGRYRIDAKIATGGMGIVYSATDERLDRKVAIKILDERLAEDPAFVERFRREARAVAALTHPNIARVFDYAEDADHHFIVMELAEGHDLARVLRDEGALPPDRAAAIAAQICTALDHAHSAGIVHRDMKPANVMVGPDDHVKVTDFGIARAVGESKLTVTGAVMGSAHYVSPEQARGAGIGPASDIYSTGIVMYEMATGAVPFTGESLMAVAARQITDTVPPPSAANPSVPPSYDSIVARATAKEPRDRYPDASAMEAALTTVTLSAASPNGDAGTTAALAAPSSTAVLEAQETTSTVWPIPGDRWDPNRVGRWVVGVFVALALIAGVLLLARLGDIDPSPKEAQRSPQGDIEAGGFQMPKNVIGANYLTVASVFDNNDQPYQPVFVDPAEFGSDLPEGEIVATDPAPGETVPEGETITLYVSNGGDEDNDDEHGPPDHSEGKGKDKEKD